VVIFFSHQEKITPHSRRSGSLFETNSAISIVNAIGTGYGGAIGIDLSCTALAAFESKKETLTVKTNVRDVHKLVPHCFEYVKKTLGVNAPPGMGVTVEIDSAIPVAVGLKSSSAVSTSVVGAFSKLFLSEKHLPHPKTLLEISCRASRSSGASITGALDDACACLAGGMVLTDNTNFHILRHSAVPRELGRLVLVSFPPRRKVYTSSTRKRSLRQFRESSMEAFQLAKKLEYVAGAMMLNSLVQCSTLGYSFEPILLALREGATCAGVTGKGPALAAMCHSTKISNRIRKAWKETSPSWMIIDTRIVQPKELVHKF
jgi:shikimate kinase